MFMIQQITAYRFEQLNRQTEQLSNLLIFKFLNSPFKKLNKTTNLLIHFHNPDRLSFTSV